MMDVELPYTSREYNEDTTVLCAKIRTSRRGRSSQAVRAASSHGTYLALRKIRTHGTAAETIMYKTKILEYDTSDNVERCTQELPIHSPTFLAAFCSRATRISKCTSHLAA